MFGKIFLSQVYHITQITIIGSKLVQKDTECGLACLQVTSCSSFNLATFPDINGKLLCELLPSDKHRMPNELIHNPMFHHFSKTVSVVESKNTLVTLELSYIKINRFKCFSKFRD